MPKELMVITDESALYFAGFFDGEGCVGLYERLAKHCGNALTPNISIGLSIANTNVEVLKHIHRTIGGHRPEKGHVKPTMNGSPGKKLFRWAAQSRESYHILKRVLPYLIVKREQALLAIEFHESILYFKSQPHPGTIGKPRLTDSEMERRRDYVRRMKLLKGS